MIIIMCCLCVVLTIWETCVVFSVIHKYKKLQRDYNDLRSRYDDVTTALELAEDSVEIIAHERKCYKRRLEDYEHYII